VYLVDLKSFDPNRVIGGQRTITTDYVYMRIEEMHLLNAEAKSRLGNDSDARVVLKNLLTIRNGRSLFRCYVRNYIAKKKFTYKLELNFG
jgi:hypothetical protein